MNSTISIIVPVYNVEDYLRQCIESILNQKYQDFELILVNDGSTDSSGEICNEYSKKDSRIRVRHKENGGQSSARNVGLDLATGKYIGFVDSDDWIHEDMYNKLINHAINLDSDVVACNFFIMKKDLSFVPYTKFATNQEFTRESAMKEIFKNEILTFSPCNKIYKKSLFDNIRFIEGIILEDKDISYKLIYKSQRISYIKNELYYYRYNSQSTLRSHFSIKRLDEYIVQKNMYNFYNDRYPDVSDIVYFDVFNIGSFLYTQILLNLKVDESMYKYLIEFDYRVLKRLLKNKQLSKTNRIKVWMGVYLPSLSICLRKLNHRIKKQYSVINMRIRKEFRWRCI